MDVPSFIILLLVALAALGALLRWPAEGRPVLPGFKAAPPPPAPPAPVLRHKRWYPLLVSELQTGKIYRDTLSRRRVRVLSVDAEPDLANCGPDHAVGVMHCATTATRVEHTFHDLELETDNLTNAPIALARITEAIMPRTSATPDPST